MWEAHLNDLNTVIQLSIALNLACVAAFKSSKFGHVIEKHVMPTNGKIEKEKSKIVSQSFIYKKNALLLAEDNAIIASGINALNLKIEKLDKEVDKTVIDIKKHIDSRCTPKFMAELCTFVSIMSIVYLFFILFGAKQSTFCIFTVLFILGVAAFAFLKFFHNEILEPKIDRIELTQKDKPDKLLINLKNLKLFLSHLLSVKYSILLALIIIVLTPIINAFYHNYYFDDILPKYKMTITNLSYIASSILPYSTFVVYSLVLIAYNMKRNKVITQRFLLLKDKYKRVCEPLNGAKLFSDLLKMSNTNTSES